MSAKPATAVKKTSSRRGKKPVSEISVPDAQRFLEGLFKQTRAGSRITAAEILRLVLDIQNGTVPAMSEVTNPVAYAEMEVVADFEEKIGYKSTADIDRAILQYVRKNNPAKNGKRVKDVLETAKSVLTQEYELAKAAARRALP